jgi:hypothetical protein
MIFFFKKKFVEGKWNVWEPWYLMIPDKLCNVRWSVSFVTLSFHITTKCFFICAIDMMAMEELVLRCVVQLLEELSLIQTRTQLY